MSPDDGRPATAPDDEEGGRSTADVDSDGVAAGLGFSFVLLAAGGVTDSEFLVALGLFVFLAVGGVLVVAAAHGESPETDTPSPGGRQGDAGLGVLILGSGGLVVVGVAGGVGLITALGSMLAMAVMGAVAVTWVLSDDGEVGGG